MLNIRIWEMKDVLLDFIKNTLKYTSLFDFVCMEDVGKHDRDMKFLPLVNYNGVGIPMPQATNQTLDYLEENDENIINKIWF